MSKYRTGEAEQRDIEEGKQFALSLGMSPEQVAALYDAPSPPPPPQPSPPHMGEPLSKYRKAVLVWLTIVIAVCGTVVVIHYSCELCRAYEHVYYDR